MITQEDIDDCVIEASLDSIIDAEERANALFTGLSDKDVALAKAVAHNILKNIGEQFDLDPNEYKDRIVIVTKALAFASIITEIMEQPDFRVCDV
jgi:hypothetical protein